MNFFCLDGTTDRAELQVQCFLKKYLRNVKVETVVYRIKSIPQMQVGIIQRQSESTAQNMPLKLPLSNILILLKIQPHISPRPRAARPILTCCFLSFQLSVKRVLKPLSGFNVAFRRLCRAETRADMRLYFCAQTEDEFQSSLLIKHNSKQSGCRYLDKNS